MYHPVPPQHTKEHSSLDRGSVGPGCGDRGAALANPGSSPTCRLPCETSPIPKSSPFPPQRARSVHVVDDGAASPEFRAG